MKNFDHKHIESYAYLMILNQGLLNTAFKMAIGYLWIGFQSLGAGGKCSVISSSTVAVDPLCTVYEAQEFYRGSLRRTEVSFVLRCCRCSGLWDSLWSSSEVPPSSTVPSGHGALHINHNVHVIMCLSG